MANKVFQIQAKDSVVKFNAFDAVNGVQSLNIDPVFNEEYFTELGNPDYTAQARNPETGGSFDTTGTASFPAVLARMIYNYTTQAYAFDPTTKGNTFSFIETDLEPAVFDLINLKQPGNAFSEATLIPNAQLTGLSFKADANGVSSESYSFQGELQETFYSPYHDMIAVPLTTASATTATIPAAYANVNSGTYGLMYVFQNNTKFDSTQASFTASTTVTIPTAALTTAAPFDRVSGIFFKLVPGTFPTIYYPTTARFVRGDRVDIWLVASGTALSDANRLLRCQSADISVGLGRDTLREINRNLRKNTIYWRALNYPLRITASLNILESDLTTLATIMGKTLNTSATTSVIDSNNILTLNDFISCKIVMKWYKYGSETALATVQLDDYNITGMGEKQQVNGRAERAFSFTGSRISITGING